MTWQDELRQLDEALAEGRVSAEDYRNRRDQLLASAASVAPRAGDKGSTDSAKEPGTGSPFPPPFRWNAETPAETTQVIGAVAGEDAEPTPGDSDRTQVVPGETTQVVHRPPTGDPAHPGPPSAPGQPAPGQPPGQPPQGQPPQGQPPPVHDPWAGHQVGSNAPPWANADSEPLLSWGSFQPQGPEVFETRGGGKGKVFAILAVALLVVVATAGTVYLTLLRPGNGAAPQNPPAASVTTTVATSTSKPPETFGPLFIPEGRTSGPKTFKAEELFAAKPLPTPDLLVLKQAGLSEAKSIVVVSKATTTSIWAFTPGSDPADLEELLLTDQARFGFVEAPDAAQGDVRAFSSKQESASRTVHVFRTHYVSGPDVIRVESFDVSDDVAREQFDHVLEQQLKHNPPT